MYLWDHDKNIVERGRAGNVLVLRIKEEIEVMYIYIYLVDTAGIGLNTALLADPPWTLYTVSLHEGGDCLYLCR